MSNVGILSFEVYNQDGNNELYLTSNPNHVQTLRLRVMNESLKHNIEFHKGDQGHFSLAFKKGILPHEFTPTQISVSKWRVIEGQDIFNTSVLKSIDAFDMKSLHSKFDFDIQDVIHELDVLAIKKRGGLAKVTSGFDEIVEELIEKFGDDSKWVKEVVEVKNLYLHSLTQLQTFAESSSVITKTPFLAKGFEQITNVFQDIANLHSRTRKLTSDLEAYTIEALRKKEQLTNHAYDELKEKLVTQLKPFIEETFQPKKLFSDALQDVKINDLIQLDQVKLNDDLIKKLNNNLMVEDDLKTSNWNIEHKSTDEEDLLYFTCLTDDAFELKRYGYLLLDLKLKGALAGKAESTQVELRYPNAKFLLNGQEEQGIDKFSQSTLNLVNYGDTGLQVPLSLTVVKGDQILNNGTCENEITLHLSNRSDQKLSINANAQIRLHFDVELEKEIKPFALTDKSNAQNVNVALRNMLKTRSKTTTFSKSDTIKQILKNQYCPTGFLDDFSPVFSPYAYVFYKGHEDKNNRFYYPLVYAFQKVEEASNTYAIYTIANVVSQNHSISNYGIEKYGEKKLVSKVCIHIIKKDDDYQYIEFEELIGKQNAFNQVPDDLEQIYQYEFAEDCTVLPQQGFQIDVSKLKTALPVGATALRISMLDLSSYKNTDFNAPLNRVSYVQDDHSGIFTIGDQNNGLLIQQESVEIAGGEHKITLDGEKGINLSEGVLKELKLLLFPVGSIMMLGCKGSSCI